MTAPTRFDVSAAYSAQSRSDDGIALLPGDLELIAALEGWCQQGHDRLDDERINAELAEWLADKCPACEDGGAGEACAQHVNDFCYCGKPAVGGECASCHNDRDRAMQRAEDI